MDSFGIPEQRYDIKIGTEQSQNATIIDFDKNSIAANPFSEIINLKNDYETARHALKYGGSELDEGIKKFSSVLTNGYDCFDEEGNFKPEAQEYIKALADANMDALQMHSGINPASDTKSIVMAFMQLSVCGHTGENNIRIIDMNSFIESLGADTQVETTDIDEDNADDIVDNSSEPTKITETSEDIGQVIEEETEEYLASDAELSYMDLNNYWYTCGRMSYYTAYNNLQKDIMELYGISEDDPDKDKKIDMACDDIISLNSDKIKLLPHMDKIESIMYIGNDGRDNDIIQITKHDASQEDNETETKTEDIDIDTSYETQVLEDEADNIISENIDTEEILTDEQNIEENDELAEEQNVELTDDNIESTVDETTEDSIEIPTEEKDEATESVVSEETSDKYFECSIDENSNQVKIEYLKENGVISSKPNRIVTYNPEGKIISEENDDCYIVYNYPKNTYTQYEAIKYKKTENGIVTKPFEQVIMYTNDSYMVDKYTYNDDGSTQIRRIDYDLNGIEKYHEDITKYVDDEGHKVTLTVTDDGKKTKRVQNLEDNYYTDYIDYNNDGIDDEKVEQTCGLATSTILNVDLSFDGNSQGDTGDCWMLAALKAFSSNNQGLEMLKENFTDNGDGSYSIYFNGVKTEITVTNNELTELRNNEALSTGDTTYLLYEAAWRKLLTMASDDRYNPKYSVLFSAEGPLSSQNKTDDILSGGTLNYFTSVMFGKASTDYIIACSNSSALAGFDYKKYPAFITFDSNGNATGTSDFLDGFYSYTDNNGKTCKFYQPHAYTLTSIDKDNGTISFCNPQNNYEIYTFNIDFLLKNCGTISLSYCVI